MLQKDVVVGCLYIIRLEGRPVRVQVVAEREGETTWQRKTVTRFLVARVKDDGTLGPVLPKQRTAAAFE